LIFLCTFWEYKTVVKKMDHDIDTSTLDLTAHDARLGRVAFGTTGSSSSLQPLLPSLGGTVAKYASLEDAPQNGRLVGIGSKSVNDHSPGTSKKTVRLLVLRRSTNEVLADIRRFSWGGCFRELAQPIAFQCIPQDDISLEMERWVSTPTDPAHPRPIREGIPHNQMEFHVQQ
jgi:hypothetical protein